MSISNSSTAGKSGPKLVNDFLLFDPLKSPPRSNLLTDLPPPVGEGQQLGPQIGSCKHEYTVKARQSALLPLDARPEQGSRFRVAAICKKCRIHADVQITYPLSTDPCPNSDFPLHHFAYDPARDSRGHGSLEFMWQCTAHACKAELQASFRPPRLNESDRALLTSTENLKSRYEAVVRDDPKREGIRQATPMEAMSRLRKYIKDSLNPDHTRRSFPASNKRFMEAFGVLGRDCADLLTKLGFKYADSNWQLPDPDNAEDASHLGPGGLRSFLEDVELELLASMFKLSADMGTLNPAAAEGWPSADREIERILAAQGYLRQPLVSRRGIAATETLPYYASLGAAPDFADALISFAFDRQIDCDPPQQAYYFECLQMIANSRGTEDLQLKVATTASQGLVSRKELADAYTRLNLSLPGATNVDDEKILSLFYVLQTDSGPDAQEEARQALYKIGTVRGSQKLINASRQTIETYEDALSWLGNGVTKETPDETLLVVAAMKTSENSSLESVAQKAISVIARERQSNQLNNWVMTGRSDGYQMSTDEALRHLGIDQNLASIEPTLLPAIFENARADRPGDQTEKAIAAIHQAMADLSTSPAHSPDSWPVGLTSHGNTCYLNSLLQYYFSIKPLREIILNYDDYKLDSSKYSEKQERVGQRKISMVEIKGGQRFAQDLKHLFERMIKDPGPAVKPEEGLVCRAFLEPKDYALLTSDSKGHPSNEAALGEAALGEAALGSGAPTSSEVSGTNDSKAIPAGEFDKGQQSEASSTTLQASIEVDSDSDKDGDVTMKTGDMPLTPPASPGIDALDQPGKAASAPPLPPRGPVSAKESALEIAESNARQQQDVTEVHDGILFRLRSGMMAQGKDESEEQCDQLRDLFSIRLVETPVKQGVEGKKKDLSDSSIQLDVPTATTDLYAALDAVFDLQSFDEGQKLETYKSIKQLPPVLQINIPRIGFDQDGHGGAYKSDACVKLPDELYLDRYVDGSHADVLPKRKACWGWRRQLNALRKEHTSLSTRTADLDGPVVVGETANFLESLSGTNEELAAIGVDGLAIDADLPSALRSEAKMQGQRLNQLDDQIRDYESRLYSQFELMKDLKYRLAAAFFHRGSYGHGHYWIYIRDFEKDLWRLYNDEKVEEFSKLEEIFEAKSWNHGTPTYAVYVREGKKTDYIQPVCRAIEQPPSPPLGATQADSAKLLDTPMLNTESQPIGQGSLLD